jgi:hypothetical protein
VTLGHIFSEYFCSSVISVLSRHHLSSGAGTIGHLVTGIPSGLSVTPPHGRAEVKLCLYFFFSQNPIRKQRSVIFSNCYVRNRNTGGFFVIGTRDHCGPRPMESYLQIFGGTLGQGSARRENNTKRRRRYQYMPVQSGIRTHDPRFRVVLSLHGVADQRKHSLAVKEIRRGSSGTFISAYLTKLYQLKLITVAARSNALSVLARSNAGIVSSNPTEGMDVCVVCVYSVCSRGLATG